MGLLSPQCIRAWLIWSITSSTKLAAVALLYMLRLRITPQQSRHPDVAKTPGTADHTFNAPG